MSVWWDPDLNFINFDFLDVFFANYHEIKETRDDGSFSSVTYLT